MAECTFIVDPSAGHIFLIIMSLSWVSQRLEYSQFKYLYIKYKLSRKLIKYWINQPYLTVAQLTIHHCHSLLIYFSATASRNERLYKHNKPICFGCYRNLKGCY